MSTFNKDQHTGLKPERAPDDDNACKCLIFQWTRPGHKPEQKLEAKLDWTTVNCKVNWACYSAPEPTISRRVLSAKHNFFLENRESGPHKIGVHRGLSYEKHRLTWKLFAKGRDKHLHPWRLMYCRRHDIKALRGPLNTSHRHVYNEPNVLLSTTNQFETAVMLSLVWKKFQFQCVLQLSRNSE